MGSCFSEMDDCRTEKNIFQSRGLKYLTKDKLFSGFFSDKIFEMYQIERCISKSGRKTRFKEKQRKNERSESFRKTRNAEVFFFQNLCMTTSNLSEKSL